MQETPTRLDNILDLTFTSNPSLIKNSQVIPGISEHYIVVSDSIIRPHYLPQKKRQIFLFAKANWDLLKERYSDISVKLKEMSDSGENVVSLWSFFKSNLMKEIQDFIPYKNSSSRKSLPWLNRSLHRMVRKKARLYTQARKNKNWSKYRQFQKDCKHAFRKAGWDYINNFLQEGLANNNTKPFWRYVKSKKQDNIGVSPLKQRGQLLNDSKSKAELLLSQFSSVFTRAQSGPLPKVNTWIDSSLTSITIDTRGVEKLLSTIKTNKAPGLDNIPDVVLRECASQLAPAVTLIFQKSLKTGILPADWTNANVSPIFKKGDRHLPENYRPVSLTSVISKLLEHIISSNMLRHFEANKVLTNLNHGFRSGYSCESQLAVTIDELTKNYDLGLQTDIAILDFSKAFNTVPHNKLMHKLHSYGIRGNLDRWIRSFLCDCRMKVVVDGVSSSETDVISGVPQGTVLGPLLFLCHINDLPEGVSSSVRLFADDCLLYRTIRTLKDHQALQTDLRNLEKWATEWGMSFNATKCYILPVKKKSSFYYQLNDTILKEVTTNPYLGITISNTLKWSQHINNVCSKASCTLGFVRRNL